MARKTKKDIGQLAKKMADIATGEIEDVKKETVSEIKSATTALGRLGRLKGGKARTKGLSAKRKSKN